VRTATATIVPPDERSGGAPRRLTLTWVDEDTLEARFPLQKAGLYLGAVQLGAGTVLRLAPLSLPYSPEFEPRPDPREGRNTLREIARVTGGVERTTWDGIFNASRLRSRQVRDLVMPLTLMLLVLHVAEVGGRRLLLFTAARVWLKTARFPRLRRARPRPAVAPPDRTGAPAGEAPTGVPPKPATSPLARAKAKARSRMRG
jgi:hypothetical protein